jgi:hypothetical protein
MIEAELVELGQEVSVREAVWRVSEQVPRHPIVVADIVVLGDQSPAWGQDSGDLGEGNSPLRHMVQHGEVEHSVERRVWIWESGDVSDLDGDAVAVTAQPSLGSVDHSRIEVDRGDCSSAEEINFACNAFTGPASDIEDSESVGAAAQLDQLGADLLTEASRSCSACDVQGLGLVHPHLKTLRPCDLRSPGTRWRAASDRYETVTSARREHLDAA